MIKNKRPLPRHVAAIGIVLAALWLLAPLHGFVSHQFGMLQSPFGWLEFPSEPLPRRQWVSDAADLEKSREAVDQLAVRRNQIGVPSISAAIFQNGQLRWAGAVGWADIEGRHPATLSTRYRIGSTSKAITATLLARSVDRGIVSVDLSMKDCVRDLPNPDWGKLTLYQLASHTAGIVGYEENRDIVGLYQSMALTSRFQDSVSSLSVFDGSDLLFEPGTDYHYTSYDFVMLAACLEAQTGRPLVEQLEQIVSSPLGVGPLELDGISPVSGDRAQFFLRAGSRYRPWRPVDLSHKAAGGGVVASPAAIAAIGAAWLDDGFISGPTRELFWTPVKLAEGATNEEDYALGWRRKVWLVDDLGKVENLNHGGVSKGSQFWLMVVPEHNLSLAIAANGITEEFFDFANVSRELLTIFVAGEGVNGKEN